MVRIRILYYQNLLIQDQVIIDPVPWLESKKKIELWKMI
jgi:hypothetical protein